MRRTAALSVLALLALTGCSTEVRGQASPAEVVAPPAEDDATEDDATGDDATGGADPGSASAPDEPDTGTAVFGDTLEYDDGLTVTVSAPQPFTPSDSAHVDGPAPAAFVAFDVTVGNGTATDYDPIGLFVTLQSGSTEEAQVFDTEQGLEGAPYTTLLPGREVSFRIGFGASVPDDLVLQLSPGFEYEPVLFTG